MFTSMHGTIRYRLLLNWAADPTAVEPLLPHPFRPQLVDGHAVIGVCALHLAHLRPAHLPAAAGLTTSNAAHRVAVEWDTEEGPRTGVWIWRRDSGHRVGVLAGGRVFPGPHGRAEVRVDEEPERLAISYRTHDGWAVDATATPATGWRSRLFASEADASAFFHQGSRGFSHDRDGRVDCIDLLCDTWSAEAVDLDARATWFDDVLPPGAAQLDCGLLMRDLEVTWRAAKRGS